MFNNMRFVLKNPDYPLTFNNINMFLKANYVKSVSISMYVMSLFQNIISKIPQSNFTLKKKILKSICKNSDCHIFLIKNC